MGWFQRETRVKPPFCSPFIKVTTHKHVVGGWHLRAVKRDPKQTRARFRKSGACFAGGISAEHSSLGDPLASVGGVTCGSSNCRNTEPLNVLFCFLPVPERRSSAAILGKQIYSACKKCALKTRSHHQSESICLTVPFLVVQPTEKPRETTHFVGAS